MMDSYPTVIRKLFPAMVMFYSIRRLANTLSCLRGVSGGVTEVGRPSITLGSTDLWAEPERMKRREGAASQPLPLCFLIADAT